MIGATRSNRLRDGLAARGLDSAVIRHPANVRYLTGYPAGPALPCFAVVGRDQVVLVAPYHDDAARTSVEPSLSVIGYITPGGTLE